MQSAAANQQLVELEIAVVSPYIINNMDCSAFHTRPDGVEMSVVGYEDMHSYHCRKHASPFSFVAMSAIAL